MWHEKSEEVWLKGMVGMCPLVIRFLGLGGADEELAALRSLGCTRVTLTLLCAIHILKMEKVLAHVAPTSIL